MAACYLHQCAPFRHNHIQRLRSRQLVKVPEHRRQWACACRDHGSVYIRLNEYRIADFQY